MRQQIRSILSVCVLTLMIVALYAAGNLYYDKTISRQIEAFGESGNEQNAVNANKPDNDSVGEGTGNTKNAGGNISPNERYFGYLQPIVVDGFTEEPIEGAVVVIPEIGQKFITSGDGSTSRIKVPILEDKHFKGIEPKTWGEVTVMVYKEGYIEYVLFYTHVWENQTRNGPKILLFPEVEGEENEPFAVIEGPHRLWVKELVEKYKP